MNWKPDKSRPICPQLYERICVEIASFTYNAGDKLPSVRELAVKIGVNPNTVQRSYELLEQDGVIYTERNLGRFVSQNTDIAKQVVKNLAKMKTEEYIRSMFSLGMSIESVETCIKEWDK